MKSASPEIAFCAEHNTHYRSDGACMFCEAPAEPDFHNDEKSLRNRRVQSRYDELMQDGKHGHYETMFRVVREEIERDRADRERAKWPVSGPSFGGR